MALVAADKVGERARRVGERTGGEWMELDVEDESRLRAALDGVDTVFNATGPYHLLGLKVVDAAISTNTHYVDMADDHEMTEALFLNPDWDRRAREEGWQFCRGVGSCRGSAGCLPGTDVMKWTSPER